MNTGKLVVTTLVGATLCGVTAAGCGGGGTKQEVVPPVRVPNLIGRTSLHAQALLRERGLRWRWGDGTDPAVANGFTAEAVEGQTPAVGQWVKPGTVVTLGSGSMLIRPSGVTPFG